MMNDTKIFAGDILRRIFFWHCCATLENKPDTFYNSEFSSFLYRTSYKVKATVFSSIIATSVIYRKKNLNYLEFVCLHNFFCHSFNTRFQLKNFLFIRKHSKRSSEKKWQIERRKKFLDDKREAEDKAKHEGVNAGSKWWHLLV